MAEGGDAPLPPRPTGLGLTLRTVAGLERERGSRPPSLGRLRGDGDGGLPAWLKFYEKVFSGFDFFQESLS